MFPITEQEILLILILIVIFLVFIVLRWLYFCLKLRSTHQCRKEYLQILEILSNREQQNFQNYDRLAKIEQDYFKLFEQAKIYHSMIVVPSEQQEKYGDMGPTSSVVKYNVQMFSETIGYFQARTNESFSPVFWIESFINWPKTVLGNLGFNQDGAIANFLKLAFLFLEVVGGFILLSDRLL